MIGLLEHVKQNPHELDMLINQIRAEIHAESQLKWFNKRLQPDNINTIFSQINNDPRFESYPQCTGAFTKLAETAASAYAELERFPLCLQIVFRYTEPTVVDQTVDEDSNEDVNIIISTILKQMAQYLKPQSEEDTPYIIGTKPNTEINLHQYVINNEAQTLSEPITEIQPLIAQPVTEQIIVPQYTNAPHIISIPNQNTNTEEPYTQLEVSSEVSPMQPDYVSDEPEPQYMPSQQQQQQPSYMPSQEQQQPIYSLQDLPLEPTYMPIQELPEQQFDYNNMPLPYQPPDHDRPQTHMIELHQTGDDGFPLQELPYDEPNVYQMTPVIQPEPNLYKPQPTMAYDYQPETYPEAYVDQKDSMYVEPTQEIYIEHQSQPIYYDTKEVLLEPKSYYPAPGSVYVEPTSIYVESKPVFIDSQKVYLEPQPVHVEPMPTGLYVEPAGDIYSEVILQQQDEEKITHTSKANTINVLLQLIRDQPSPTKINNIITILKQNRAVFKPRLYKILFALLNGYKKGAIDADEFNETFYFLLHPQNKIWNDEKKQLLFHLLLPDVDGQVDLNKLDIIAPLMHAQDETSLNILDEILPIFKAIKEGNGDQRAIEIILTLLTQNQNGILRPDQINILLSLIKPNKKGLVSPKYIDIVGPLAHWDKISYLNPEYVNIIFTLLRPNMQGQVDTRAAEVIHELLTPKKTNFLTQKDINIIFSFLKSDSGVIEPKRLDVVLFILKNMSRAPRIIGSLIKLLKDGDIAMQSKYIDIILALQRRHLLNSQLLEGLINLLKQERHGDVDQHNINNVLLLLAPYKATHPKIFIDIYNQLKPVPLPNNIDMNVNTMPDNVKVLLYYLMNPGGDRIPNVHIPGLPPVLIQESGQYGNSQSMKLNLLSKILQMLQWEQKRELASETLANNYGFVELTYLLKHQQPLLYQPIYYVKYKIPMINFLANAKTLIAQKPQLSADPARLLQELIIEGNVSEISPNLKGYRKEDILKLTFKDGDLVQAKVLDEKSLNLNEQIKLIHNLNSDVSPEEILQQNQLNAAKYYSHYGTSHVMTQSYGNLGGVTNLGIIGNLRGWGGAGNVGGMRPVSHVENIANYDSMGKLDTLPNEYDGSLGYSQTYFSKRRGVTTPQLRSEGEETADTRQNATVTSIDENVSQ